jgi:hypothetical protein
MGKHYKSVMAFIFLDLFNKDFTVSSFAIDTCLGCKNLKLLNKHFGARNRSNMFPTILTSYGSCAIIIH